MWTATVEHIMEKIARSAEIAAKVALGHSHAALRIRGWRLPIAIDCCGGLSCGQNVTAIIQVDLGKDEEQQEGDFLS
jgi:hypothetical protein